MDTIIYIYKKRDLQKPVIDSLQMKDYLLVRVGLNVGEDRWFSHGFAPSELPQKRFGRLFYQRQQKRRLRAERELAAREIQSFLTELGRIIDDRYDCRCVYADVVQKCLTDPGTDETRLLPLLWRQYWQFPEFSAYLQPRWMEILLGNVRLHRFVVLGCADSTPSAILHCAGRMKSLRWFLQERDCGQELQDFVEEFYGEYGLAVDLQPLEGERVFSRLLLETVEPVCVLDFTGESRIPVGGLAQGSMWIDFCSLEEKARRILEREEGISYFSLKEIWKHAGKP